MRQIRHVQFVLVVLALVWSTTGFSQEFRQENLRMLMISPESNGIFKTGGLADASTGLAEGLTEAGVTTEMLMPFFFEMNTPKNLSYSNRHYQVELDFREGRSHKTTDFFVVTDASKAVKTHFLRHNSAPGTRNYFDNQSLGKTKKTYGPQDIEGEAFGAFAKAAANFALDGGYPIVMLNDWTAGLIAPLIRQEAARRGIAAPKIVFAIHNIAYQGVFPKSLADYLGLDPRHFTMEGVEYWGQLSFLKAGLMHSDMVYTVSDQYANEITTERFGLGMDGIMRNLRDQFRLTGVLNAIDPKKWDPSTRHHPDMKHTFSANDLSGKAKGKAELQAMFGLQVSPETPVFILTSRLAEQKGMEYLIDALSDAASHNRMQVLIIGDGEERYVARAKELEARFPEKVRYARFSDSLEHVATAYGDFFVNAAWFEPSGLNQFYALLNGTIPLVSRVGGLASSVRNGDNGFTFEVVPSADGKGYDIQATRQAIVAKITEAVKTFETNPERIRSMRLTGMHERHSWTNRVQSEFRALLDLVMNDGPKKLAQGIHKRIGKVLKPSQMSKALDVVTGKQTARGMMCEGVFAR